MSDTFIALKPGQRLRSAVSPVDLIVIKPGSGPIDLRCGGVPVILHSDSSFSEVEVAGETIVGKRYTSPTDIKLEILCTKGGPGILSIGDEPLIIQAPRQLPASD